jgi:hypothetical protein
LTVDVDDTIVLFQPVSSPKPISFSSIFMCRNIKPLFNFAPPTTDDEIRAAALQFVRKISGFQKPAAINAAAFDEAVLEITNAAKTLLLSLTTSAPPKDRDAEAEKRRILNERRFKK